MHPLAPQMMTLFAGNDQSHGLYNPDKEPINGKVLGERRTIKGTVSIDLWDKHLMGRQGLGIVPIRDDSSVHFGAIDIDDYQSNIAIIVSKIREADLPVIPCRTKSGGWHLYLFTEEPTPAQAIQGKLQEIASFIGYGNSEIFPKQSKLLADRGDQGSWINMPYFKAVDTDRYAIDHQCNQLKLEAFLKWAFLIRQSPERFADIKINLKSDELSDGPPCLQQLMAQGFPEGTRNNGLFNYGIYAIKKNPDGMETMIEEFNTKYMEPPLSSAEVTAIIASLKKKKEYMYTCKRPPIVSFCNAALCRTREHGVDVGTCMPKIGSLTKLNTDPPIWFMDVQDGGRVELTTNQLQNMTYFQQRCMESLNIMPSILKRDGWEQIVQELLKSITVVDVPKDATPQGQLLEHLEAFCTGRVQGRGVEDLFSGKPILLDDKHIFRMKDLLAYLTRIKFTEFKQSKVVSILKDFGAKHEFFNVKGRAVNCWSIPEYKKREELSTPDQEEVF